MEIQESDLQKLIDGQLSVSDRQNLLLSIEYNEPERWRDLSLGFVEAQLMREAFTGVDEEAPVQVKTPARKALLGAALAASVALGVFLGWQLPEWDQGTVPAGNQHQVVSVPEPPELPHYGTLEVEAMDSQPVTIPVLDASDRDFTLQNALELSENPMQEMQVALQNEGYESSLETSYVTATLNDGRQLLIPVHRVVIEQEKN